MESVSGVQFGQVIDIGCDGLDANIPPLWHQRCDEHCSKRLPLLVWQSVNLFMWYDNTDASLDPERKDRRMSNKSILPKDAMISIHPNRQPVNQSIPPQTKSPQIENNSINTNYK